MAEEELVERIDDGPRQPLGQRSKRSQPGQIVISQLEEAPTAPELGLVELQPSHQAAQVGSSRMPRSDRRFVPG